MAVLKIFEISRGTMRCLSLVKFWRLLQLFRRRTLPLTLNLQGITVFTNWLGLLLCETNLITRKTVFRRNFQWSAGPKHLALTAWKRYYSNYALRQFIMYRLKIVTHVYIKFWVANNLVLISFYNSGINRSIVYG